EGRHPGVASALAADGVVAAEGAAGGAGIARHLADRPRCVDRHQHLVDGHRPLVAGGVPEHLVVGLEAVEGAADPVGDRVAVGPRDGAVWVSDPEPGEAALTLDLDL